MRIWPSLIGLCPESASTSWLWPLPETPATPTISPAPHCQIEAGDRVAAFVVLDEQPGDFQRPAALRRGDARGRGAHDRVADHHRRHFARREFADLAAADLGAAAQHADVVAKGFDLAELMGDHQRGDLAAMRHRLEEAEDFVGFIRRQHRSRLVENEEALVEIEQLQNFQLLLFPRRERGDGPIERHAERHALKKRLERLALLAPIDEGGRVGAARDQILGRGQRRHEGEMLIDHADAERLRVARIAHDDLFAVEQQASAVGRVEAHHAFDQGRLARAVLAEQRMEGAGGNLDRNVVERGEAAEGLGHADRLERRAARVGVGRGSFSAAASVMSPLPRRRLRRRR